MGEMKRGWYQFAKPRRDAVAYRVTPKSLVLLATSPSTRPLPGTIVVRRWFAGVRGFYPKGDGEIIVIRRGIDSSH